MKRKRVCDDKIGIKVAYFTKDGSAMGGEFFHVAPETWNQCMEDQKNDPAWTIVKQNDTEMIIEFNDKPSVDDLAITRMHMTVHDYKRMT